MNPTEKYMESVFKDNEISEIYKLEYRIAVLEERIEYLKKELAYAQRVNDERD